MLFVVLNVHLTYPIPSTLTGPLIPLDCFIEAGGGLMAPTKSCLLVVTQTEAPESQITLKEAIMLSFVSKRKRDSLMYSATEAPIAMV